ncbi:PEP-CTERM sorting domain-containing protein [bacterium]|nr:PEP-CTERM sorting domain-containing protein [bacterium]
MKAIKLLLTCLVISLFIIGQVWAINVVDVYDDDLNEITGIDVSPGTVEVFEDYNETHLIPYPSHDGYAVVNHRDEFFDKVVTVNPSDIGMTAVWNFDFIVENTTPYVWSDYHFEFWNETFSTPIAFPSVFAWDGGIFTNSALNGNVLEFWAPGWQNPGDTNTFHMQIDLFILGLDLGFSPFAEQYSFGIRQVATTVPEPGTILLLGFGLLGLAGYGIHRKKKNS